MSMFEEIAKQSGLKFVTGYSVINYGGEALYIEGVSRLLFLSRELIKVSAGKKQLEVAGSEMVISSLGSGEIIIKGGIKSITECGNV